MAEVHGQYATSVIHRRFSDGSCDLVVTGWDGYKLFHRSYYRDIPAARMRYEQVLSEIAIMVAKQAMGVPADDVKPSTNLPRFVP